MKDLIIEGTKVIPNVIFKTNGIMLMEGRAIPENSAVLFDPILNWVKNIEVSEIELTINLEYFNTAVSKQLMEFFHELDMNPLIEKISVNWHYEDGDDDNFESGMFYREYFPNIHFEFHVFADFI